WRSPRTMTWSSSSRRIVPTNLSAKPFCQALGARSGTVRAPCRRAACRTRRRRSDRDRGWMRGDVDVQHASALGVAHCALEGLPNKVMAAEYRTALPKERALVAEIEKTIHHLEARRAGVPPRRAPSRAAGRA